MTTKINFQLYKNATLDKIYIMVEDDGYEIKDEKPNELRIFIPIESGYLVSKNPFLSLRTENAIDNESISLLLKTYSKYGLCHSYQKDGEYYNFVIYNEAIEFIMKAVNNELNHYFKDSQFYICISSRFSGTTITNTLNNIELPEFYGLIPESFANNIYYDENMIISDLVCEYNLDKYYSVLSRLVNNKTIEDDIDLLNELAEKLQLKSNVKIKNSNGNVIPAEKIVELINNHMETFTSSMETSPPMEQSPPMEKSIEY